MHARAAQMEALRQRARASELLMRADAVPPVQHGFAAQSPVFAHGCNHGFSGAQHVRGAIIAARLTKAAATDRTAAATKHAAAVAELATAAAERAAAAAELASATALRKELRDAVDLLRD